METTLAILMVLGIFVGIPVVIGLAIGGVYILRDRQVRKIKRARAVAEAETLVRKPVKERVLIAYYNTSTGIK